MPRLSAATGSWYLITKGLRWRWVRREAVQRQKASTVEVDRAKPGEKPGMSVTETTVAVGVVKAVDHKTRMVTLQGAERTLHLEASKDVDLSKVKVGDTAEAVYIQSYAVQVVAAPKVSGTIKLEDHLGRRRNRCGVGPWHADPERRHHPQGQNQRPVGDRRRCLQDRGKRRGVQSRRTDRPERHFFSRDRQALPWARAVSATAMKNANGVVHTAQVDPKGCQADPRPGGIVD